MTGGLRRAGTLPLSLALGLAAALAMAGLLWWFAGYQEELAARERGEAGIRLGQAARQLIAAAAPEAILERTLSRQFYHLKPDQTIYATAFDWIAWCRSLHDALSRFVRPEAADTFLFFCFDPRGEVASVGQPLPADLADARTYWRGMRSHLREVWHHPQDPGWETHRRDGERILHRWLFPLATIQAVFELDRFQKVLKDGVGNLLYVLSLYGEVPGVSPPQVFGLFLRLPAAALDWDALARTAVEDRLDRQGGPVAMVVAPLAGEVTLPPDPGRAGPGMPVPGAVWEPERPTPPLPPFGDGHPPSGLPLVPPVREPGPPARRPPPAGEVRWLTGLPPWPAGRPPAVTGEVERQGDWFVAAFPLFPGQPHRLVLGSPVPLLARTPPWWPSWRWGLLAGACLAGTGLGAALARPALQTLRVRLLVLFLLAAGCPAAFFLRLGLERFSTWETVQRVAWESRLQHLLGLLDQHFRFRVEGFQLPLSRLARRLEALPPDRPLRPDHLERLHRQAPSGFELQFNDVVRDETHLFTSQKAAQDSHLRSGFLPGLIRGVWDDILPFQPRGEPAGQPRRDRTRLKVQDFVGEGIPYQAMFLSPGKLVQTILADRTFLSYYAPVRTPTGRIRGFLFGVSGLVGTTRTFLAWFDRRPDRPYPECLLHQVAHFGSVPFLGSAFPQAVGLLRFVEEGRGGACTIGPAPDGDRLIAARATRFFNEYQVVASVRTDLLRRDADRLFLQLCLGAAGAAGLALVLALVLWRRLVIPIRCLQERAVQVAAGRLDARLPVNSPDELGHLAFSFNEMTDGLLQRERIRRFISDEVWHATAAGGGEAVTRTRLAVLFSDIRGFTTLSETHPAPAIVDLLNDYFTEVDRIIRFHGGTIDKFIGDAVQAFFKEVPGLPDPGVRAARAGLRLREWVAALDRLRVRRNLFPIETGVGVCVGTGIIGRVGAAAGRSDVTVIGPIVQEAARLEALSKFGSLSRVLVGGDIAAIRAELALEPRDHEGSTGWEVRA
ncbi:MAG: adenylate/guanylate cyclase domain-containing protein [Candidatus Riflebacteria bacterium]|nr:adenylate/guanylate cyclase domain-containing protein [Candidatus Riflebacteria bacterium]